MQMIRSAERTLSRGRNKRTKTWQQTEIKAVSTPRAELSGADDVNKRREGRKTQKKNSPRTETKLWQFFCYDLDSTVLNTRWCTSSRTAQLLM